MPRLTLRMNSDMVRWKLSALCLILSRSRPEILTVKLMLRGSSDRGRPPILPHARKRLLSFSLSACKKASFSASADWSKSQPDQSKSSSFDMMLYFTFFDRREKNKIEESDQREALRTL